MHIEGGRREEAWCRFSPRIQHRATSERVREKGLSVSGSDGGGFVKNAAALLPKRVVCGDNGRLKDETA